MNHYKSFHNPVGYKLRGFETLVGGEGDEELATSLKLFSVGKFSGLALSAHNVT